MIRLRSSSSRWIGSRLWPPSARAFACSDPSRMSSVDLDSYDEVMRAFSWTRVWELFDGNEAGMNLTHECIDRHRAGGTAVSVKFADGHSEHYDFAELSDLTGR